ncbi:MAG TPA: hypothetical protein VKZ18_25625 [Polyangia bacterium]|nr:hypothetical protein [Polyangia bacterium]
MRLPSPASTLASAARGRRAALGASLVGAALPLIVLAVIRPGHEIRAAAAWGLVVVLAFAGWGDLVRRLLAPAAEVDWGLRAAWGLAATVVLGGLFCLLGLARWPVLVAWTCGGVALLAQALVPRRRGAPGGAAAGPATPAGWELLPVVGVACLTAFVYLGSAGHTFPNPSDDWPAYLSFVQKLLQTGGMIEPFSVRRMAAYGGQTLLQALTSVVAGETQIQLFDGGVCLVLTVGLVVGFAREARSVIWMLLTLTALAVLMLPDGRANSASEMSGVVGFVATWRTATFVDRRDLRGWRGAMLAALPLAAVATLRQNYLVPVVVMLFTWAARGGRPDERWDDRLRFFWQVAAATGACLLPWAVLALRSNGTFLFPLFHGNFHPDAGGISVPTPWHERLKGCFSAVFYETPIHPTLLLVLALPAAAAGANRRASIGLWLGAILGFGFLCWKLPDSDNYTLARYAFAGVVALIVVAGLAAAESTSSEGLTKRGVTAAGLVATALALQVYGTHDAALKSLNGALDRLRHVDTSPDAVTAHPELEQKMQAAVPPGAPLLVMIDRPFLLDFARNPIEILDQPGGASPPPGIPFVQGSEAVAGYLRARGFRYFGFVRPEKAVTPPYSRQQWVNYQSGGPPLWKATAPYMLAAFDVVGQLAQHQHRVYDDGTLVVVDLAVSG